MIGRIWLQAGIALPLLCLLAEGGSVVSTSPRGWDAAVPASTTIVASLDGGALGEMNYFLHSSWRGDRAGAVSGSATTAAFTPDSAFLPGEPLEASLSSTGLARPFTWQFQAAPGGGSGVFVTNANAVVLDTAGTARFRNIALADVEGDGKLDLVAPGWGSGLLLVVSNGSQVAGTTTLARAIQDVAVGDFNRDGRPDLLFGCATQAFAVATNGGAGFAEAGGGVQSVAGVSGPLRRVAVADLDGDGDQDGVALAETSGHVIPLLNDASGALSAGSTTACTTPLYGLDIGDIDGDGRPDAVAVGPAGYLAVMTNSGAGTFAIDRVTNVCDQTLYACRIADFNRDGHADIAAAGAEGVVVVGYGSPTGLAFRTVAHGLSLPTIYGLAVGDCDANGLPDLVTCGGDSIAVLIGTGGGFLSYLDPLAIPGEALRDVEIGDWDGDGRLDLLVCGFLSGKLYAYLNAPAPTPVVLGTNGAAITSGAAPSVLSGTDFGTLPVLSTVTSSFRLVNDGQGTLQIGEVSVVGVSTSEMQIVGMPLVLEPGATSAFSVVLSPASVGIISGVLTIANNSPVGSGRSPYLVNLAAEAVKRPVDVLTLAETNQVYDGTPRPVSVAVEPSSLEPDVVVTYEGESAPPSTAGVYTVAAVVSNDLYRGAVTGRLTIARRLLTVVCADAIRAYGDANPVFAFTITDYAGGEGETNLLSVPVAGCAAPSNSWVGTYPIVAANGHAANYSFVYSNGTLTVTQAVLLARAENKQRLYGEPNPPLTIAYEGWRCGDDTNDLAELPQVSTDAGQSSPVGPYAIHVANGSATNYSFAYSNGILRVNGADATVTISNTNQIYDGGPHEVELATGPTGLSCQVTYNGSAAPPITAGVYAVCAEVTEPNYQGSTSAVLTIAKASQTIASFLPTNGVYPSEHLLALTATGSLSGIPIVFAVSSGPGVLASPSELRFTDFGPVAVAAWQPGDANWAPSSALTNWYSAADTNRMHYAASAGQKPAWPYVSWQTAASNIQDAVDVAAPGETVLVGAGAYAAGGRIAAGAGLASRLVLDKAVSVQAVEGSDSTFIVGRAGTGAAAPLGPDAVRCAFLTNGAILAGFTLTNGFTSGSGSIADQSGGGVLAAASAIASNCTIAGCGAVYGGGMRGGTVSRCVFVANSATLDGGGVHGSELFNSVVSAGSARYGGGAFRSTLRNCTVRGNAAVYGGGAFEGLLRNALVYENSGGDLHGSDARFTCAANGVVHGSDGCITNAPLFAGTGSGGAYLLHDSPCINAGSDAEAPAGGLAEPFTDIAGRPRILHGAVDLGANEYAGTPAAVVVAAPSDVWACGFTAQWAAPTGTVTTRGYALEVTNAVTPAPSAVTLGDASATSRAVGGLAPGTAYRYRVQARNEFAHGPWSAWADVVTLTEGALDAAGSPDFLAVYAGPDPAPQSFELANRGETALAWSRTVVYGGGGGWLSLSVTSGVLGAGAASAVTASVSIAGLDAGTYTATNRFASPTATNSPRIQVVTLKVARGADAILIGGTNRVYDGAPQPVAVSVLSGSPVSVRYDGSPTAPSTAGTYTVTAVVDAPNWTATNTATLTIRKADQSITGFEPESGTYASTSTLFLAAAGGGSGNAVTFAVSSGPGVVLDGAQVRFTGLGAVVVTARQEGDENWNPAAPVSRTYLVAPVSNLTHYVALGGQTPVWPFHSWATAASNIQEAIDASTAGDRIVVGPGLYASGARPAGGALEANRVCVDRPVAVVSAEGPAVTIIAGGPNVRGAWLEAGSSLEGFTLVNGATRTDGDLLFDQSGGGVLALAGAEVRRCIIEANTAAEFGGGVCLVGGGRLVSCLVDRNRARTGGGVHSVGGGAVESCSVLDNAALARGGGLSFFDGGSVLNAIVYHNVDSLGPADVFIQGSGSACSYTCAGSGVAPGVDGCLTNAPRFVDRAGGDYRLQPFSPGFGAGLNEGWMTGAVDLGGRPRILCGTVDMGAYETPAPWLAVSPAAVALSALETQTGTNRDVQVWNAGGSGALAYSVTADVPWLTVAPVAGSSTGEADCVELIASAVGLLPGVYTGTVTVSSAAEAGGSRTVAVRFAVGALSVDLIIDDQDPEGVIVTGTWFPRARVNAFAGSELHDGDADKGTKSVAFIPGLPVSGEYQVYLWYEQGLACSEAVPVDVRHAGGRQTYWVDQTRDGGRWNLLGQHFFQAGTDGRVRVRTTDTIGRVIADAVRFVRVPPTAPHLAVWPTNLTAGCQKGANPEPCALGIWNCATGALGYTVTANVPWLAVAPGTGSSSGEQDVVMIDFLASGLPTGIYSGVLTVSAPDAYQPLWEIPVSLSVDERAAVFAVPSHVTMASGPSFVIHWGSVANETYTIERAEDLSAGFVSLTNGLPATPPENEYRDSPEGLERAFYRVLVD